MMQVNKNSRSNVVYEETLKRINRLLNSDDATVKARLAELRHGIGSSPGEIPALWGMIFDKLPETMLGKYGKSSKEEWAIYYALMLYALHQQGKDYKTHNMNKKDVSLGKAAGMLVGFYGGKDEDRDRVSRRFNQIALADDIKTMTYYLRMFIPLLSKADIGMDYARLAKDIYLYQTESGRTSIRLEWGQDYYRYNYKNAEE